MAQQKNSFSARTTGRICQIEWGEVIICGYKKRKEEDRVLLMLKHDPIWKGILFKIWFWRRRQVF